MYKNKNNTPELHASTPDVEIKSNRHHSQIIELTYSNSNIELHNSGQAIYHQIHINYELQRGHNGVVKCGAGRRHGACHGPRHLPCIYSRTSFLVP